MNYETDEQWQKLKKNFKNSSTKPNRAENQPYDSELG